MTVGNGRLALLFHAAFIAFILAPLIVVGLVAFTPEAYLSIPTTRWSLRWFVAIWNSDFIPAFWISLYVGCASATIALLVSVPAAIATARHQFPGRDALVAYFLSPLMVPHVVLGVALLRFMAEVGLTANIFGLIMGHVIVIMPFTLRLALAALTGMNRHCEWAAWSLGAPLSVVFRRVTLPMIMPGLAGGWLLAFIQSFDELTMTVFVASPGTTTLPVRMFQYITDNIDPMVASISTALMLLAVVMMAAMERVYGLERLLAGKGDN
ncbi:MAG: ABC transporter permease [Alphaproteobacteria bacterium]|nr:ABC transporter permease [Alphaproteobacteria bacterium]